MSELGVEIINTEETQEHGVKYLNINVSNSEVERDPDVVRLCADTGILEYAKPCDNVISRQETIKYLCTNMNWYDEDGGTAGDEEKLNAITDLVNGVPSVTQQPCEDKYLREIDHLRKYISKLETQIVDQEPCDKCVYSTSEGCQYDDITETIPPFDDCISRQAVLDAINIDWHEDLSQLEDAIKALPPVEPKTGHWINCGSFVECSECGEEQYGIDTGRFYCQNCGAKMVEPQEGDDIE